MTTSSSEESLIPFHSATAWGESSGPALSTDGATLTSRASWLPWYAPSNLAILGLPVAARASRVAWSDASVPELTKRTFSAPGSLRVSSSAISHSSSVGAPSARPLRISASTASITDGWLWPRITAVWWLAKSV